MSDFSRQEKVDGLLGVAVLIKNICKLLDKLFQVTKNKELESSLLSNTHS